MNSKEFQDILGKQLESITSVLASKRAEYAPSDDDRLHNFRVAAGLLGTSLPSAAYGMALKHIVSVNDIVLNSTKGVPIPDDAVLDEKFGDAINYFILIKACLIDQRNHDERNRVQTKAPQTNVEE